MTIDTPLTTLVRFYHRSWNFAKCKFIGKYRELIEDNREVSGRAFGEKEL